MDDKDKIYWARALMGMDDKDKIYWTRALMGLVAGVLSAVTYILSPGDMRGITIGILFYLVSYYIVKYFLRIKVDEEKKITPRTIFLNGVGTYIIVWLLIWILMINLF